MARVLNHRGPVGRALRLPLRFLPRGMAMPILAGSLRGARWIVGAGQYRCLVGAYEPREQKVLVELVKPGGVVYDLGAHAGFHTLLASRLAGAGGRVVAVEPSPRSLDHLRRHLALNEVDNVTVVPVALGEIPGRKRFAEAPDSYLRRLDPKGELEVEVVTLDALVVRDRLPAPDVVKCDVEGRELHVLRGGREVFTRSRPAIVLSAHSHDLEVKCTRLLSSWGYKVRSLAPQELVATPLPQIPSAS